jgi:tetratricopeptide (TPR) repeat protein
LALAQAAEAKQRSEEQGVWLDRLECEHDNLRAALSWCCSAGGNAADGLSLAVALGWFWRSRGHLGEGRRWLSEVINATPTMLGSPIRADALVWAGILAMDQVDYPVAQALQEEALAIYRKLGDRLGTVRALNRLGILAAEQANHAAAQRLFADSMVMVRELGDPQGTSMTLTNLGVVTQLLGDLSGAQALFEEALAIERTLGNQATIAMLTNNVGQTLYMQGEYPRAQVLLKQALAIWNELGMRFRLVFSMGDFGSLFWLQGQPARAARVWGREERLREEIGFGSSPMAHALGGGYIAAARTAMGDDAFEAAWAEGRAMALDQVIQELLDS